MITKFSVNGKSIPEERTFIKDNADIIQDMICDSIKAALQPFYQLNDIYCERLKAIESKMYAFDQAMGKELRALQSAVRMLPNMTQYSLGDACGRIDKIHEKLVKMGDNISSILQGSKTRDTDVLQRLFTLESLIMQVPGLKEAIEAEEFKIKSAIEAKVLAEKEAGLDILIEDLELSVRSHNCLKNDGFKCIRDLIEKTRAEMLRVPNFGHKSLRELEELLASMNLKFGEMPDLTKKLGESYAIEVKNVHDLLCEQLDHRAALMLIRRHAETPQKSYLEIGKLHKVSGTRAQQIIVKGRWIIKKYYRKHLESKRITEKELLVLLGGSQSLYDEVLPKY